MPGNAVAAKFQIFYYIFMHWSLCRVIYDAAGCTLGPIWVHTRVDMGSHERAVMGLESRAVSARVKHFVTIF